MPYQGLVVRVFFRIGNIKNFEVHYHYQHPSSKNFGHERKIISTYR